MTTGESIVESMNINLRCPREGHDKQPLSYIFPVTNTK